MDIDCTFFLCDFYFLKKYFLQSKQKYQKNLINFFYAVSKNFETEDIFKVLTALLLLQQNQSFFPFLFQAAVQKGKLERDWNKLFREGKTVSFL